MNEEQIKAAKAAWQRDPDTAAKALLGMIAEEVFIQAIRGCNQHSHKPGCPDAEGGRENITSEQKVKKLAGKYAKVVNKKTGKFIKQHQMTYDDASAVVAWAEKGVDKDGHFWFFNNGEKYIIDDKDLAKIFKED